MITEETLKAEGYDKYFAELAALGRMAQAIVNRAETDRSIIKYQRECIKTAVSNILFAIVEGAGELTKGNQA